MDLVRNIYHADLLKAIKINIYHTRYSYMVEQWASIFFRLFSSAHKAQCALCADDSFFWPRAMWILNAIWIKWFCCICASDDGFSPISVRCTENGRQRIWISNQLHSKRPWWWPFSRWISHISSSLVRLRMSIKYLHIINIQSAIACCLLRTSWISIRKIKSTQRIPQ